MSGDFERTLKTAIKIERSKWIEPYCVRDEPDITSEFEKSKSIEPPDVVPSPVAINNGWCKVFAERVYERLGCPDDVYVNSDGKTHTWIEYNGMCYDSQCICGVSHPSLLPIYNSY